MIDVYLHWEVEEATYELVASSGFLPKVSAVKLSEDKNVLKNGKKNKKVKSFILLCERTLTLI